MSLLSTGRAPTGGARNCQNLLLVLSYICHVINEPGSCQDCPNYPIDPHCDQYFENRRIFAQYYLMNKGLWEEAKRVLESIISQPIGEAYPLYNAFSQSEARALLEKIARRH